MLNGNWPNIITLLRIVLIPIFILAFYIPGDLGYWLSSGIFIFACLTDWLDGYLARRLRQESRFGAFLDPVADKLIVVVALILLVEEYSTPILSIPAVVIISREIVISALRELMAEFGRSKQVAVAYVGKVKTFLQMTSIVVILTQPHYLDFSNYIIDIGFVLLYISMFLTLWSMFIYLHASWGILNNRE